MGEAIPTAVMPDSLYRASILAVFRIHPPLPTGGDDEARWFIPGMVNRAFIVNPREIFLAY